MVADCISECERPGAILSMCVYFELRAPREVAVQQGTACGARSGRCGQLAALGQLSWQFSLDHRGSNGNQRVSTRELQDLSSELRTTQVFSSRVRINC